MGLLAHRNNSKTFGTTLYSLTHPKLGKDVISTFITYVKYVKIAIKEIGPVRRYAQSKIDMLCQ